MCSVVGAVVVPPVQGMLLAVISAFCSFLALRERPANDR